MKIEKDVQLFRAVVKTNLARISERVALRWPRETSEFRADRVESYLWRAFEERDRFDPSEEAWITWFGRIMANEDAADGYGKVAPRWPDEDDAPEPTRARSVHAPDFGGGYITVLAVQLPIQQPRGSDIGLVNIVPMARHAVDCPPCWRCRYFDGWLPEDEEAAVRASADAALDPDIAESCLRLDRNKVRIAKWVRGMGWENLEDDE